MKSTEVYLYGEHGPWPQPSPRFPAGMPAAVRKLPFREQLELSLLVISRYRFTLTAYRPIAFAFSLRNPHLEEVPDDEFTRLMTETAFSKFLNPNLDLADRRVFSGFLRKKKNAGKFFKADFSGMALIKPLPGIYVSPTVTLFRRTLSASLEPVCISINEILLTPDDGEAWELAKYFVLQGATTHLVTGFHAWLHFPMDAINAITKTSLPTGHLLFKLLIPHLRISLALNDRVLEHPRTILNNSQDEIYTPFAGSADGIRELVSAAYRGMRGNSSYRTYRYPRRPPQVHSQFGNIVDAYYDTIYRFVSQVVRRIPKNDPQVRAWARHISGWVPGFPGEEEIFEADTLAAAVSFFICDVSVMHAADHISFSSQPLNRLPFRLRVPPPRSKRSRFDRRKLVRRDDVFRYKMAHQLFFKPTTLSRLRSTRYPFEDPELKQLNDRFLDDLRETEKSLGELGKQVPLDAIARSIQY